MVAPAPTSSLSPQALLALSQYAQQAPVPLPGTINASGAPGPTGQSPASSAALMAPPLPAEQPSILPLPSLPSGDQTSFGPSSNSSMGTTAQQLIQQKPLRNPVGNPEITTLADKVANPVKSALITGGVLGTIGVGIAGAFLAFRNSWKLTGELWKQAGITGALTGAVAGVSEFFSARAANRRYGPMIDQLGPGATVQQAELVLQSQQPVYSPTPSSGSGSVAPRLSTGAPVQMPNPSPSPSPSA